MDTSSASEEKQESSVRNTSFRHFLFFFKENHILLYAAFFLIVILSVLGIWIYHSYRSAQIPPPYLNQKQQVVDELTASNIKLLEDTISLYVQKKGSLPDNIATILNSLDLEAKKSMELDVKDQGITYSPKNDNVYELCATFLTDTTQKEYKGLFGDPLPPDPVRNHAKGRTCFELSEEMPSMILSPTN